MGILFCELSSHLKGGIMARRIKTTKSPTQLAYSKELSRIKRSIRRLEQRGYVFDKSPIKEVKRPTKASITKLQKVSTKDLYKKATYKTPEGKIITGEERLKQERSERAKKSAETRRARREAELKFFEENIITENIRFEYSVRNQKQTFEEQMRTRDEEAKKKLRDDEEFRRKFTQGEIVYQQILDMIRSQSTFRERSAQSLEQALQSDIAEFAFNETMEAMANAPQEFVESAQTALNYDPNDERHVMAITHIYQLIKGTALTIEEAQRIHDIVDSESYENGI